MEVVSSLRVGVCRRIYTGGLLRVYFKIFLAPALEFEFLLEPISPPSPTLIVLVTPWRVQMTCQNVRERNSRWLSIGELMAYLHCRNGSSQLQRFNLRVVITRRLRVNVPRETCELSDICKNPPLHFDFGALILTF